MNRVQVIKETSRVFPNLSDCQLCLQWCLYVYDDGTTENGYRFIWRKDNGNMRPDRGQARIPSIEVATELIQKAKAEGWGNHEGEM